MKFYAYFLALLIPVLLVSCSTTQDKSDDELANDLVSSTFDETDSFSEEDFLTDSDDSDIEFIPDEEINVVNIDPDYEALPGTKATQPVTVINPPRYYSSSHVQFTADETGYPDNSSDQGLQGSYVVKRGDSLWTISRRFGSSVDAIARANNLSPNGLLKVGKSLVIPSGSGRSYSSPSYAGGKTYVVRKGDSYYSIGKQFGISSQKLMSYNGAKSTLLKIGQTIRIP